MSKCTYLTAVVLGLLIFTILIIHTAELALGPSAAGDRLILLLIKAQSAAAVLLATCLIGQELKRAQKTSAK